MKSQPIALFMIAGAVLVLLLLRRIELILIVAPLALALGLLAKPRRSVQQRKIGENEAASQKPRQ